MVQPVNLHRVIHLSECFFEPRDPAQHRGLPTQQARIGDGGLVNQGGGEVAAADVLPQRIADQFFDGGALR